MKIILSSLALFLALITTTFSQGTLNAEFVNASAQVDNVTEQDENGLFMINFKVTATGDDILLDRLAIWSLSPGSVQDSFSTLTAISLNIVQTPESFILNEGDTGVFEFHVYLDPGTTGFYGVELDSLDWATSSDPNSVNSLVLDQSFKTPIVLLQGTVVPEPSTVVLGGLVGVCSLLFYKRRKR